MDEPKVFGRLLRGHRKACDLTQAALARQAACALDTVKKIEAGTRRPSRELAAQFAHVLSLEGDERAAFLGAARAMPAGPDPQIVDLSPTLRHNLPHQPTVFIGRAGELAALDQLLRDRYTRLVTIVAPGGMGKTRLALEAARRIAEYLDGVYVAFLAPVSSPTLLVSTVAEALALPLYGGADPEAQLLTFLREKRLLLVLDNFEHLLEGTKLLAKILNGAPGVKLLVTSRERLNLQEEWLFPLQGLQVPNDDQMTATAAEYSAVQLFVQRAAQVCPGFTLSPDVQAEVVRVCRLVEGMPLGIELAAAWVRILSCAEIAAEIGRNLDFLATSASNVPDRHRSLRAAFEHSWRLLSEAEQNVFQHLAVFRGGFRREAAEQVASASLPVLGALIDKSLLRAHPSGRYDMHELLRQYAEEKLEATAGAWDTVHAAHARFYLRWLGDKEQTLYEGNEQADLVAIDAEIENVRAATSWAIAQGHWAELRHMLMSLCIWYDARNLFQEGADVFARAAERAHSEREASAMDVAGNAAHAIVHGLAHAIQGWFCYRLSQVEKARTYARDGTALLRALGARPDLARALLVQGTIAAAHGPYAEAKQSLQECFSLLQETQSDHLYPFVLLQLGLASYALSDYAEAEHYFRQGLAVSQRNGNARFVGYCLGCLGNVARSLGQYALAQERYQESLAVLTRIGDRWGMGIALSRLGRVAFTGGAYAEARHRYEEGLALFTAINQTALVASTLGKLGRVAFARGRYEEAKRLHQESLVLSRAGGDKRAMAISLNYLGQSSCALDDDQAAWHSFHEALASAREIDDIPMMLDALAGLAGMLAREGQREQAIETVELILHHSCATQHVKTAAAELLADLATHVPPDVVALVRERGRARPLDQFVEVLLSAQAAQK